MDIASLLGDNVAATIEQYVLSQDPQKFLQSLPDTREKKILHALIQPFSKDLLEDLKKSGIPNTLANDIYQRKKNQFIQQVKTYDEAQDVFDETKNLKGLLGNYSRPAQVKQQHKGENNIQQKKPNIFNPKYPSQNLTEYFLQAAKKCQLQKRFDKLSDFAVRQLPHQYLLNLPVDMKEKFMERTFLLYTLDSQFIADFFNVFIGEKKRNYLAYELSPHYYQNLTSEQINRIGNKIPDLFSNSSFVQKWFMSNYGSKHSILTQKNEFLSFSQKQEKRKLLQNIPEEIDEQKKSYFPMKGLIEQLFIDLLMVDLSIKDPDIKRFIKYLQNLKNPLPVLRDAIKQKIYRDRQVLPIVPLNICNYLESINYYPNSLLENYLNGLIIKYIGKQISILDSQVLKYIDEVQYLRAKAKIYLQKGEPLQILSNVLSEQQKSVLKEKKMLTIMENNKPSFGVNEQVSIQVKTKKINKIAIKIYELNLEKHYLQKQQEINEQVNLHYLEPTYLTNYQIENSDPFKETIYDIPIKDIKKERGIYVVDFDAEGLSSRAIIRKGAIFCHKKLTLAGVQLKFYDESGKKIEELDIWLGGKKIHINKSYIIPFEQNSQTYKIIAVVGSYAEFISVNIPKEQYNLDMKYFYNPESFIVGTKAKIILHPRLQFVGGARQGPQKMSLKLLRNIRAKIEIQDYENVKSALSLQNITWTHQQDYVVEIPIQTHIKSISIEGSAEIKMYNGNKEQLRFNKTIQIHQREKSEFFHDIYLKKEGKNYYLHVLGLNGEPVPNMSFTCMVAYKWINDQEDATLISDQNGKINLGPLNNVHTLKIRANHASHLIFKVWKIQQNEGTANMLNNLNFREGEKIVVPLPFTKYQIKVGEDVNLASSSKSNINELYNSHIKVNQRFIQITNLPSAKYTLSILSIGVHISINIIKGVDWEEPNQMYCPQKSTVYQFIRNPSHYLMLNEAEFQDLENGFKKVTVKIIHPQNAKILSSVKAHIFATNFITNTTNLSQNFPTLNLKDVRIGRFEEKKNSYYSNKVLSEEASYVLNRKNEKQFIGNNLQKPKIFLNRIKVRETNQKDEQMKIGAGYKQKNRQNLQMNDLVDFDDMSSNIAQQRQQSQYNSYNFNQGGSFLSTHNNFLAQSGFTIENIKDNIISFELPPFYNCFQIVLISDASQIIQKYECEQCDNTNIKNIKHLGIKKEESENEAWSMSRQIYKVHKGETVNVNRNSKWCTVSLINIINFAKTKGLVLDDWVSRWSTYTQQTKIKVYSKKICHQLNSYIKHHDCQFFSNVVRPYIQNKVNKTFVDLCLLDDRQCMEWAPLEYFEQLNDFQKILLIQFMVKNQEKQLAIRAAKAMELRQKIKKQSYFIFKKEFDTMLNAKIGQNNSKLAPPTAPPPPPLQSNSRSQNLNNLFGLSGGFGKSSTYQSSVPPPPPPGMSMCAFGSPPPPPPPAMMAMRAPISPTYGMSNNFDSFGFMDEEENNEIGFIQQRQTYSQVFKQVQKTEQFTEVTYQDIISTNQNLNKSLIPQERFWADLATYITEGNLDFQNFITDSILYLTSQRQFTLASCFIPKALNANYDISTEGQNFKIKANTSFLIFSKEIKCIGRKNKFGIMVNHRFFDPKDQYSYEDDGTRIEKEVRQFIYLTPYSLETVVTNISGTELDVQLLIDIPQGAIPLLTNQYTQNINTNISPFSTQSFKRLFYFPEPGEYQFYTTSVSWNNTVIGKGNQLETIKVGKKKTINELKTFTDVIASGSKDDIVEFLKNKNIFDSNIFNSSQILWMLEDKKMFQAVTNILRERGLMDKNIWSFSFLHKDLKTIKQYLVLANKSDPPKSDPLKVFEYFPYYSSRAHKYTNQNKSKIRNVQFKQTYFNFLFEKLCYHSQHQCKIGSFKLSLCYYLLLQDRVDEASSVFKTLGQRQKKQHQIQIDYLECFLDMYEGYPSFNQARRICQKYIDYPILRWKDMFLEINATLKEYDSAVYVENPEVKQADFETVVFNEGQEIRVSIPANTKVQVLIFPLNLQLMFSENPFEEVQSFSAVKPAKQIVLSAGEARDEKVRRDEDLKDAIVHVYSTKQGLPSRKVSSFMWSNPSIKVKVNENRGNLQIFYKKKCITGCYCKVYSQGSKGQRFYRDGYTDITGTFKYALSDLKQINMFSILATTTHGSIITKVKPPSQIGLLGMI